MGEHPVVDRLRGLTRGLRTTALSTVMAAAILSPLTAAVASPADPASEATTTGEVQVVSAPDPATVSDGSDAGTPATGSTPGPHGPTTEATTVVLAGHPPLPGITTSQAPRPAPTGTGLTRAPPARSAR